MAYLRPVDGFALRRLCEDVSELQGLKKGKKRLYGQWKRQAKAEGRQLRGDARTDFEQTPEGRRLQSTISAIAARIGRAELQFGLTPVSSMRLEGLVTIPAGPVPVDGLENKIA